MNRLSASQLKLKLFYNNVGSGPLYWALWPLSPWMYDIARDSKRFTLTAIMKRWFPELLNLPTHSEKLRIYRSMVKASTKIPDRVMSDAVIAQVRHEWRMCRHLRMTHTIYNEIKYARMCLTQIKYYSDYFVINEEGKVTCPDHFDETLRYPARSIALYIFMGLVLLSLFHGWWRGKAHSAFVLQETGLSVLDRYSLTAESRLRRAGGDICSLGNSDRLILTRSNQIVADFATEQEILEERRARLLKLDIARMISERALREEAEGGASSESSSSLDAALLAEMDGSAKPIDGPAIVDLVTPNSMGLAKGTTSTVRAGPRVFVNPFSKKKAELLAAAVDTEET